MKIIGAIDDMVLVQVTDDMGFAANVATKKRYPDAYIDSINANGDYEPDLPNDLPSVDEIKDYPLA